jgi:hypothetical protein
MPNMTTEKVADVPSVKKQLILLRGLPWTGKSYQSKKLLEKHPEGKIFSTDEYWYKINFPDRPEEYSFNRNLLGTAHKWNQLRAQRAIDMGDPLIIIDNTNTTADEFCCPYLKYASFQGYEIEIQEPTSDKWLEIKELLRNKKANWKKLKEWAKTLSEGSKETHSVPVLVIEGMMRRWQCDLDPKVVLENCRQKHT